MKTIGRLDITFMYLLYLF